MARAHLPWPSPSASGSPFHPVRLSGRFGDTNCTNANENYSFHPAGAHAVFGDGSVRLLRPAMSIRIMGRLLTRAGGEVLDGSEF